jgi:hypothetical protein
MAVDSRLMWPSEGKNSALHRAREARQRRFAINDVPAWQIANALKAQTLSQRRLAQPGLVLRFSREEIDLSIFPPLSARWPACR